MTRETQISCLCAKRWYAFWRRRAKMVWTRMTRTGSYHIWACLCLLGAERSSEGNHEEAFFCQFLADSGPWGHNGVSVLPHPQKPIPGTFVSKINIVTGDVPDLTHSCSRLPPTLSGHFPRI